MRVCARPTATLGRFQPSASLRLQFRHIHLLCGTASGLSVDEGCRFEASRNITTILAR